MRHADELKKAITGTHDIPWATRNRMTSAIVAWQHRDGPVDPREVADVTLIEAPHFAKAAIVFDTLVVLAAQVAELEAAHEKGDPRLGLPDAGRLIQMIKAFLNLQTWHP